jgi:hypothetical protein
MLNISTKTKITPEEAIHKVIDYFGPNGYKLKIVKQTSTSVSFEGGGGSVTATACQGESKTTLDFISVEWDYQVKEFIEALR